jgi:hypothetical protein
VKIIRAHFIQMDATMRFAVAYIGVPVALMARVQCFTNQIVKRWAAPISVMMCRVQLIHNVLIHRVRVVCQTVVAKKKNVNSAMNWAGCTSVRIAKMLNAQHQAVHVVCLMATVLKCQKTSVNIF